jgi:transcriptional regulator with XRE-family HTH domain
MAESYRTVMERSARETESFGDILREHRRRLDPRMMALGDFVRRTDRVGKPVTQEELAEAVGVTRVWYARLERSVDAKASARLVSRLADVFMLDDAERTALLLAAIPALRTPLGLDAVPELRSVSLTDTSAQILNALGSLRPLTRRLWMATTEAEALALVREFAMTGIAPDAVLTRVRVAEGRWDQVATGNHDDDERGKQSVALLGERFGPSAVDEALLYPLITEPGDVWTRSERDARLPTSLVAKLRETLDAVGWDRLSFVTACVQTPQGFVGRILVVHHAGHEYSEIERAQLSTLANLASLALSGCVSSSRPRAETQGKPL